MRTRPLSLRSVGLALVAGLGLQCNAAGPDHGDESGLGGASTDSSQGAGLEQVDPLAPPPVGPNELLLSVIDATDGAPAGSASVRWVSSAELG